MDANRDTSASASPGNVHRVAIFVAALAIGWIAFLIGMAVTSANPLTLNRRQAMLSDTIVVGQVDDVAKGTVTVVKQLRGTSYGEALVVHQLSQTNAVAGKTYLFPLTFIQLGRTQPEYVVTPDEPTNAEGYRLSNPRELPPPGRTLLPWQPEVERQVQSFLEASAAKSAR